MGRMKLFITLAALLIAADQSFAARQTLNENASPSSKGGLNSNFSKANANFVELYSLAIAAPWLAQGTAPNITNVFWVDTSGADPVIKYHNGSDWVAASSGAGGTYTLPTASEDTLGGIKVGARLTITDGVLSADVQSGGGSFSWPSAGIMVSTGSAAGTSLVADGDAIGEVVVVKNDGSGNPALPFTIDISSLTDTTAILAGKISASSTDTLTNKTIDTAGTGNVITVPLNGVLDGSITDPADADDMIYARTANAMTVTGIDCQAEGTTPSITVTLQKCNDLACGTPTAIEAAITCDADGGVHASTIDSASIPTDTPIKVLFGAPSGTVTSVRWRVTGTQTW